MCAPAASLCVAAVTCAEDQRRSCKKVGRRQVLCRLCLSKKINPFHSGGETFGQECAFRLCLIVCLSADMLYLDVCPLGMQALHTGQNLLLVAGQSHANLRQLTTNETEDFLVMTLSSFINHTLLL